MAKSLLKNKKNKTRINLLPLSDKQNIAKRNKAIFYLIVLICYIFILAGYDYLIYNDINNKRVVIFNLNQKLEIIKNNNIIYTTIHKVVLNKEKIETSLKNDSSIVNSLKSLKTKEYKKFIEIIKFPMPKGIWLNSLSSNNGNFLINGNSVSFSGISVYIKNLKKMKIFKKIYLSGIEKKIKKGNNYYTFNLECKF
ncbi:MAG: PilN domain-containing protein [Deltaproteobacteria bacterium]|nr:PilN domain-containing protein [Deltaproteobacteria bacterium]